jgi:hypothetical protein
MHVSQLPRLGAGFAPSNGGFEMRSCEVAQRQADKGSVIAAGLISGLREAGVLLP